MWPFKNDSQRLLAKEVSNLPQNVSEPPYLASSSICQITFIVFFSISIVKLFLFFGYNLYFKALILTMCSVLGTTMPRAASVFIHYGPYESCGIVEHRGERLKGLQSKSNFFLFFVNCKINS